MCACGFTDLGIRLMLSVGVIDVTCESHKAVGSKFRAPLVQDLKGAPMETVACDIMGPLTQSSNGNVYILVVMDYFTKWVEA